MKNDMDNVMIAYNNDNADIFFENCADVARSICIAGGHDYTRIAPPDFNEQTVCGNASDYSVCVIASHGDADCIYNSQDREVISVRTTNYGFSNKIIYAVSCSCAQQLGPELVRIGARLFVGYNDILQIVEEESFVNVAMSGLDSILSGNSLGETQAKMYEQYSNAIKTSKSKADKIKLLHNREHLCFIERA